MFHPFVSETPRIRLMQPLAPAPRVRQGRAIANDIRILDAAESILAKDGWQSASVLAVAERAGLSRRAVLSRFADRPGLVVEVWGQRLATPLIEALATVVRSRTASDPSAFVSEVQAFLQPSQQLQAAAELLIVSSFQQSVKDAVDATLGCALEEWLTPKSGGPSRANAARNAAALALALGVLIETRSYPDDFEMDLDRELTQIATALGMESTPRRLPADRATFLDEEPVLDTDPGMSAVLAATLRLVGRDGYEAATVDRIALECGRTSGFIFGHYANKRELFLDATGRLLAQAEENAFEFQARIAERTSWGVADATMLREIMRPEHRQVRTVTLEQYRLSWHDDDIRAAFLTPRATAIQRIMEEEPSLTKRQARGRGFIGLARGIGYGMLAQLHTYACALPTDVVSIPLVDG